MEGKGIVIKGWTYHILTNPSNFKKIVDINTLYEAIHAGTCKAMKLSQAEWNQHVAYNAARVAKGDDMYNEALSASSLGKRKLEGMCEEEEEEGEGEGEA